MAKKIILASGKGGVGKSSLTAGIAISLCKMGLNVLVVDFDIGMGCLDLILDSENTVSVYDWGDIIKGRCEPDAALRDSIGPKLLVAPHSSDDLYTNNAVIDMINYYDDKFDYILMDAPAGVNGGFKLAAACADEGIVVSTPDLVCVRVAYYAADKLFELGIKKVRLIINRFNKKLTTQGNYLNIDEVIDSTVLQLIGIVPEDRKLSYTSMTGMEPLQKSAAKNAFMRVAKRLEGININLKV